MPSRRGRKASQIGGFLSESESLHAEPAAAGQLQRSLYEELGVGVPLRELLSKSHFTSGDPLPLFQIAAAPAASPPGRSALQRSSPSDSVASSWAHAFLGSVLFANELLPQREGGFVSIAGAVRGRVQLRSSIMQLVHQTHIEPGRQGTSSTTVVLRSGNALSG